MNPPVILTEHLQLRLPEIDDIPEILRYFRENEAHLAPYDPKKPDDFYTNEFWQKRVQLHRDACESASALRLYLFHRGGASEVIGSLELSQIARGPFQACYLGYGIAARHQGKGLMYEAVRSVIGYAFGELNLHRIMANHLPENTRSEALLRRLGFVRECVAKEYLLIGGTWRDHILNSLTNRDWKSV